MVSSLLPIILGTEGPFADIDIVVFFDWKTCKMWHKIKASDSAVVGVAWHPRESSKVVTGDLDGVVKYWD